MPSTSPEMPELPPDHSHDPIPKPKKKEEGGTALRQALPAATAAGAAAGVAAGEIMLSGSMGIRNALWRDIANLSAMTILGGLFIWLIVQGPRELEKERILFRDTVDRLDAATDRRVDRIGERLDRLNEDQRVIIAEIRSLSSEVRRVQDLIERSRPKEGGGNRPPISKDRVFGRERAPYPRVLTTAGA